MTLAMIAEGVVALGAGAALAVGAAAAVLGPLWHGDDENVNGPTARDPLPQTRAVGDQGTAVDALREIEFDRATGKLSDTDYATLKATYTQQALAELRANDQPIARAAVDDDALEATIRRYRDHATVCRVCGPRPEPDARFCSTCGRYLPARCPACGGTCDGEAQRFCGDCGHALAA